MDTEIKPAFGRMGMFGGKKRNPLDKLQKLESNVTKDITCVGPVLHIPFAQMEAEKKHCLERNIPFKKDAEIFKYLNHKWSTNFQVIEVLGTKIQIENKKWPKPLE